MSNKYLCIKSEKVPGNIAKVGDIIEDYEPLSTGETVYGRINGAPAYVDKVNAIRLEPGSISNLEKVIYGLDIDQE
jgi:hypothetical protein